VIAAFVTIEWTRTLLLQDYNTRIVVLATTLLGLAAGAVGAFTLLRRRALMGDALSHAMLPGIGLAFLLAPMIGVDGKSLFVLLTGATLSGIVGTLAILFIRHQTKLQEDTALGIVLSVFFGAGLAILGLVQQASDGHAAGLESFILGKTASITAADALWIMASGAVAVAVLALGYKELKLLCFDEGYAAARGFPTLALDTALMGTVVIITVVGLQAVGLILMIALLVIPAATSQFWTNGLLQTTLLSSAVGGVSCMAGSLVSALIPEMPSGATIVLVAAGFFFISLLIGSKRGVLIRMMHRWVIERRTDRHHVLRGIYEILESQPTVASVQFDPSPNAAHPSLSIAAQDLLALRSWSASRMFREIRRCRADGLLKYVGGTIELTPIGWAEAKRLTREHRLWELYLIAHADVAPGRVDRDAERIEHVLEPDLVSRLERLLRQSGGDTDFPSSPHELAAVAPVEPNGTQTRPRLRARRK
jgi:manganese/zinc/iron transport system permease protein